MCRLAFPGSLALLGLCLLAPARSDGLKDALALEKTLQDAIQDAEPAVACILVSRSDTYTNRYSCP